MPLIQDAAVDADRTHSIILVGLPNTSLLQWDEDALLGRDECWFCLLRARGINGIGVGTVKWRAISLSSRLGDKRERDDYGNREHTPSPRKRINGPLGGSDSKDLPLFYDGGTYARYSGFSLSLSGFPESLSDSEDCTTTEFYDESVALHRDMDMTLLDEPDSNEKSITSSNYSCRQKIPSFVLPPPLPGEYTPLNRLPRLLPATNSVIPPTVNLIVGIIAVRPKFRVKTRFGKDMEVIEMLLGDESIGDSEGLRMTFWLEPEYENEQQDKKERKDSTFSVGKLLKLRSHAFRTSSTIKTSAASLSHYHRGDLIYLQHVALRVYRGRIYAQSLRNNLTKIDLYYRWIYENSKRGESGYAQQGEG
ncbi:hypothetical protein KEM54_006192 [Ascosphaera aggregata]|nr:hypothetical protein KEM54_006192 [Ascosphaera aggregata]